MTKNKLVRILLLILIILTLLFIWSNSLWGRESSSMHSGRIRAFCQQALDLLGIPLVLTDYIVRKAAHFLEFFLLGTELTVYMFCRHPLTRRDIGNILVMLFGTAFIDETLQIFSARGPAISDVWLDLSGGVTAMLLTFALYELIVACRRRGRKSRR